MKLNEISKGSSRDSSEVLRNLAVSEFLSSFPLANYAEFFSITGNSDTARLADNEIAAGTTRSIGTDYTPKTITPQFGNINLKIYGDKIATDIAYQRRGIDIGSQRVVHLANFCRSLGRYLMDATINHTLSSATFSGLKEKANTFSRKVVFDTENGGSVPNGNSSTEVKQQHKFLEFLDAQIEDIVGGPQVIIMNGAMKARLESIARNYFTTSTLQDVYGNTQVVKFYKEIPIINAGFKADVSGQVIGNDEVEGNSNNCTSIYLVRFGEASDVCFATNVGLDVQDLGLVGTSFITLVEFDLDLVVFNPKSFKRIAGIIL